MSWIHLLAKLFLSFSHALILIPLITVGFLTINRKVFGHATLLLLFTMILNAYLKAIFQIPLAPHLNKIGYAFPSGHMHTTIVFYGWLFFAIRHAFIRSLLIILMIGIGYFLIQQGYHNLLDIGGAIAFGLSSLLIYIPLTQVATLQDRPFIGGFLLLIISACLLKYIPTLPPHVPMAFIALGGFTLSWFLVNPSMQNKSSLLASMLVLIIFIAIYGLFLIITHHFHISYRLVCLFAGFSLPLAARLTTPKAIK